MESDRPVEQYDVVVVGGAFSGASTALLLRRWSPEARVLVVERSEVFGPRVGEATVELSGLFLHRVLRLYDHLSREQLPKHGLRYWFASGPEDPLEEMGEVGSMAVSALPSFQLDRARLDQAILELAAAEGAEVARPAKVVSVGLGWPESEVELEAPDGERRTVRTRWVVDGSGRQVFLGRRLGLIERFEEHPTSAAWGRWRGVLDLDGAMAAGPDPERANLPVTAASRRLATNHFLGHGWWSWVIPLRGGETSIGVVYDRRHFDLPEGASLADRYREFVSTRPGLARLVEGAEMVEGDFLAYRHLPYVSRRYMDRGWALVGDAGAFLDPYYSPGLDHAATSIVATVRILAADLGGDLSPDDLKARIGTHNDRFERSYRNWFDGLYRDKYEIMGDAPLVTASFYFDTAMYYLGVVGPAYRDPSSLANPILGLEGPQTWLAAFTMKCFLRRQVALARLRRRIGIYGSQNRGFRRYRSRFESGPRALGLLMAGVGIWLATELETAWSRLTRRGRETGSASVGTEESPKSEAA